MQPEWIPLVEAGVVLALGAAGGLVGYGLLRGKVEGLRERVDRLEAKEAAAMGQAVQLGRLEVGLQNLVDKVDTLIDELKGDRSPPAYLASSRTPRRAGRS